MPCKGYNPLTPTISSSNRGGGVAPDCMDFALKTSFPWLQAPFCLRSVNTEDRKASELTTSKHQHTEAHTFLVGEGAQPWKRGRGVQCLVHLFNSGLYSMGWSFYNQFRLSYFPLAFRLFPPWGINQNLSERKIKTRPYWIWSGFVLYSEHGY